MKICTITCHDVYNCGATLQAYALQQYLTQLGHDVEIIDYKPPYLQHYQFGKVGNPIYDKPLVKQLYLLAKLPGFIRSLKRKRIFDEFRNKYLKITEETYSNIEELRNNPPYADIYFAGSDQIWNTLFPNGKDEAFYLGFAPKQSIRASYAASFATDDIAADYRTFIKQQLQQFDYISVREKSAHKILSNLNIKGELVLDPVFLLDESNWHQMANQSSIKLRKRYILLYSFDSSRKTQALIQEISNKLGGLPIINIGPGNSNIGKNLYNSSGPKEFLNLIQNAEFILSDSFHATAFAIIFNKRFCVLNREESINTRMQSLLQLTELHTPMVEVFTPTLLDEIDYINVYKKTNYYKQQSFNYIAKVINSDSVEK